MCTLPKLILCAITAPPTKRRGCSLTLAHGYRLGEVAGACNALRGITLWATPYPRSNTQATYQIALLKAGHVLVTSPQTPSPLTAALSHRDAHTYTQERLTGCRSTPPGGRAGSTCLHTSRRNSLQARRLQRVGARMPVSNVSARRNITAARHDQTPPRRVLKLHLYSSCSLASYPLQTRSIQYSTSANSLIIFVLCVLSPS